MKNRFETPLTLPHIKRTKIEGNSANFEIEPLEKGYGMTIGHALKRVLLSSLPGAAITSIHIEGIQQESQEIPHVLEKVEDIVLNIKQLRLCSQTDEPVSLHLEGRGKGIVTAAQIVTPDTIEIINPDMHIATLQDVHALLIMDLIAETGRGYVPADSKKDYPREAIPLDAIYTPVHKVNYTVEHTRVGDMVNYEKIVLEITTNGTLTPDEALNQTGDILMRQFLILAYPERPLPETERRKVEHSGVPIPPKVYELPLEQLHLSVRSDNALKRNGQIINVGQILTRDEEELRSIRNIGDKALQEIKDCLQAAGCFPAIDPFDSQSDQFQKPPDS